MYSLIFYNLIRYDFGYLFLEAMVCKSILWCFIWVIFFVVIDLKFIFMKDLGNKFNFFNN